MSVDRQNESISCESSAEKAMVTLRRKRNTEYKMQRWTSKGGVFLCSTFEIQNAMHFAAAHLSS